jgi:hypothetical protein
MFSTSVHTDAIASRLRGLTEQLRVTKVGGRAFTVPLFSNLVARQQRWYTMQQARHNKAFFDADMKTYEQTLRKEAAMDFALTELLRGLITTEKVAFTPILVTQKRSNETSDVISGVFDVRQSLTHAEAQALIDKAAASVTPERLQELLNPDRDRKTKTRP